jgi:hypothetical protein
MIDTPTPATPQAAAQPRVVSPERARPAVAEPLLVAALIVVLLVLASLPALFGYLSQPEGRRFQGIVYGVADTAQYFSWLRDHRTDWLVSNRMTPEPNAPALFNLLWLLIGRLQAATGWGTLALFHGVRVLAGAALLALLFLTCRRFTASRGERLLAFAVVALGSGLGWIWVVAKYALRLDGVPFPFDVYVAEPNTSFILAAFPHFAIATTLILSIFLCYLAALRERRIWLVAAAALLALTLTLQHAYDLLIITLVPGGALALMLLRDRRVPWFAGLAALAIGLVALPPPLYFTWLTSRDPLWREVLDQFSNAGVFTPSPPHLLILMGVPLILALASAVDTLARAVRERRLAALLAGASDADLFLVSWLVVGFLLLYVPTDFQIHMLTAWQVPVGLIAVRWLHRRVMPAVAAARPRLARALPALLLAAVLPTSLYLISWRMLDLARHDAPYSIGRDEEAGLRWLGTTTTRDDVVLSSLALGQFVPVYADARTFLGHWAQTAHYYDKERAVAAFFDPRTSDAERLALVDRYGITYVMFSPEERALGPYDPARSAMFEPAFSDGATVIYRVRPHGGSQ